MFKDPRPVARASRLTSCWGLGEGPGLTRVLALGLALVMVLPMAGCGSRDDNTAAEVTQTEPTTTAPPATQTETDESKLPDFALPDDSKSTSARFIGKDVFTFDGIEDVMVVRGAFDWRTKTGWVTQASEDYSTELIQIDDRCYRRELSRTWKESKAQDVDGLCDAALLSNPATEYQLMSMVSNSEMVAVGKEKIQGDWVTQYRSEFSLHSDTSQIDYWVDIDGIVRRSSTVDTEGAFEITRDYLDLGLEVRVEAPTSPDAKLEDLIG